MTMATTIVEIPALDNNNCLERMKGSPGSSDSGTNLAKFSTGSDSDSLNSADSVKVIDSEPEVRRRSPKTSVSGPQRHSISSEEDLFREAELYRKRSASVLEVKEHANSRLKEELYNAQLELKLKDDECKKLAHVQEQMGKELEDLTASLFEEANKMVQDANVKRMKAEKMYKEANSKIEVLQAEVAALKELVITSTPSMPNAHLHPQIALKNGKKPSTVSNFVKGHRRCTSHHNFMQALQISSDLKPSPTQPVPKTDDREKASRQERSKLWIDPTCFQEFKQWKSSPRLDPTSSFLSRIVSQDILPCLDFTNRELSKAVYDSILKNTLTVEPAHPEQRQKCSLVDHSCICHHRIRTRDSEPWHFISQLARNRITAVCDFFAYTRYITQGLVKTKDEDVYSEIVKHRKQMNLARLGLN